MLGSPLNFLRVFAQMLPFQYLPWPPYLKFNTLAPGTLYLLSLFNFPNIYFTCLWYVSASSQQASSLSPGTLFYSLLYLQVWEKYLASSSYSPNISGMNEWVNEWMNEWISILLESPSNLEGLGQKGKTLVELWSLPHFPHCLSLFSGPAQPFNTRNHTWAGKQGRTKATGACCQDDTFLQCADFFFFFFQCADFWI